MWEQMYLWINGASNNHDSLCMTILLTAKHGHWVMRFYYKSAPFTMVTIKFFCQMNVWRLDRFLSLHAHDQDDHHQYLATNNTKDITQHGYKSPSTPG